MNKLNTRPADWCLKELKARYPDHFRESRHNKAWTDSADWRATYGLTTLNPFLSASVVANAATHIAEARLDQLLAASAAADFAIQGLGQGSLMAGLLNRQRN